jgi:hypothetical protein
MPCEMHAYEAHACEVHAHKTHAHEVHAHKMHAHEVRAYKTHALRCPIRCTPMGCINRTLWGNFYCP